MAFDPDEYLRDYGGQAVATRPRPTGFDPDAYIRDRSPVKFDPDRYIQEQTQRAAAPQEPTISQDELIAREPDLPTGIMGLAAREMGDRATQPFIAGASAAQGVPMAAGAVIHAVGTNDISKMGGLARKMPMTAIVFLVGTLSLAGIPFFGGYLSVSYTHLTLPTNREV